MMSRKLVYSGDCQAIILGPRMAKGASLKPVIPNVEDAVWHTLEVCMGYCVSQKLISRKFTKEEIFAPVV